MKKSIFIIFIFCLAVMFAVPSHAQLRKDIEYVRGTIISVDNTNKKITIKDSHSGAMRTYSIDGSRVLVPLSKGSEVLIIAKIGSTVAMTVNKVQR